MTDLLVDTSVVSIVFKGHSLAERNTAELRGRRLHVSFMTIAELRLWGLLRNWSKRRIDSLDQALRSYVVLGFDDQTAWRWAEIAAHERQSGRNRHDRGDWWIAACALRHGMPLVTHNPSDFIGIPNLQVISHPDDPPA